jgi:hypothetical protein
MPADFASVMLNLQLDSGCPDEVHDCLDVYLLMLQD